MKTQDYPFLFCQLLGQEDSSFILEEHCCKLRTEITQQYTDLLYCLEQAIIMEQLWYLAKSEIAKNKHSN